jgi:1-acyl-sn-glycerol-3-phosphate acyltransferase
MKILKKLTAYLYLGSIFIGLLFLLPFLYIFRSKNKIIRATWSKYILKLLFIDVKVEGVKDETSDMFILNHQSLLDIIVFESVTNRDIAWIAKKEIAEVPIYGHMLKAPNMITVDRENKAGLLKLLKDVKEKFNQNRPIVIFPEGTRGDGKTLKKFKAGSKLIAQKNGFKVQPVLLLNTRERLDSFSMTGSKGLVKVIYMDTISDFSDKKWFDNLYIDMQQKLTEELNR